MIRIHKHIMHHSRLNYKEIRRYVFDQSFRFLSLAKSRSAFQRKAKKKCLVIRNVSYLPDDSYAHQLDIYRPRNIARPRPVIMYIHGGGFSMCSKDTHQGVAFAYADNGYIVVNVNYRLSPKYRYPAALEDIGHAWQWILKNAEQYGGDPERIIVAGESAGGNLTLALAAACCYPITDPVAEFIRDAGSVPKSIMVLCGMLQVSDPFHLKNVCPPINPISRKINISIARDVSRSYLGPEYNKIHPDRMLADPLLIMESGLELDRLFPVTYAMAGNHDILVDHTRRLEKVLNSTQIPHQVSYFPGQGHAFHLLGLSKQAGIFWKENLAFLARIAGPFK